MKHTCIHPRWTHFHFNTLVVCLFFLLLFLRTRIFLHSYVYCAQTEQKRIFPISSSGWNTIFRACHCLLACKSNDSVFTQPHCILTCSESSNSMRSKAAQKAADVKEILVYLRGYISYTFWIVSHQSDVDINICFGISQQVTCLLNMSPNISYTCIFKLLRDQDQIVCGSSWLTLSWLGDTFRS